MVCIIPAATNPLNIFIYLQYQLIQILARPVLHVLEMKSSPPDIDVAKYLCPHALDPFEICYCRTVTGRNIPKIARYCIGSYQDCPVYKKWPETRLRKEIIS